MKLELMDWKEMESSSEEGLRTATKLVVLHELALKRAKTEIKKLNGKTTEEELEIDKAKIEAQFQAEKKEINKIVDKTKGVVAK